MNTSKQERKASGTGKSYVPSFPVSLKLIKRICLQMEKRRKKGISPTIAVCSSVHIIELSKYLTCTLIFHIYDVSSVQALASASIHLYLYQQQKKYVLP